MEQIDEKKKWMVNVSGYGPFEFEGTEAEADETRKNKARWEGGVGHMWVIDPKTEIERLQKQIGEAFACGEGVPQSLLSKLHKLKNDKST